jgi:hypothetical protein
LHEYFIKPIVFQQVEVSKYFTGELQRMCAAGRDDPAVPDDGQVEVLVVATIFGNIICQVVEVVAGMVEAIIEQTFAGEEKGGAADGR